MTSLKHKLHHTSSYYSHYVIHPTFHFRQRQSKNTKKSVINVVTSRFLFIWTIFINNSSNEICSSYFNSACLIFHTVNFFPD